METDDGFPPAFDDVPLENDASALSVDGKVFSVATVQPSIARRDPLDRFLSAYHRFPLLFVVTVVLSFTTRFLLVRPRLVAALEAGPAGT